MTSNPQTTEILVPSGEKIKVQAKSIQNCSGLPIKINPLGEGIFEVWGSKEEDQIIKVTHEN
jgi:hypothetical protein